MEHWNPTNGAVPSVFGQICGHDQFSGKSLVRRLGLKNNGAAAMKQIQKPAPGGIFQRKKEKKHSISEEITFLIS